MMIWNGTLQPRLKHRCYFAPLSCGWTSILLEVLNVFQRWCVREFQILLKKGSSIMYYQMHFPFPWLTPRYPGKISKLISLYVSWILCIFGFFYLYYNNFSFYSERKCRYQASRSLQFSWHQPTLDKSQPDISPVLTRCVSVTSPAAKTNVIKISKWPQIR